MKKILLLLVLVLATSIFLAAASKPPKAQVWLEIRNHTDGPVNLLLKGYGTKVELPQQYYFRTKPDSLNIFWVERNLYARTTWACGYKTTGDLDMEHNTRLTFVPCNRPPVDYGIPGYEKVFYSSYYTYQGGARIKVTNASPFGLDYHYQY